MSSQAKPQAASNCSECKYGKLVCLGGAALLGAYLLYRCRGQCCGSRKPARPDAELVRENWDLLRGDLQGAGDLFYATLFEMHPSLKTGIFGKTDIKFQALRLMQMVDGAIRLLDDTETLVSVLLQLGERHVKYGTKPEHYPAVGGALLATLKKALGEKFTKDHEAAWTRVYGLIQDTMIKGAANAK